jgi:hypothetical protein
LLQEFTNFYSFILRSNFFFLLLTCQLVPSSKLPPKHFSFSILILYSLNKFTCHHLLFPFGLQSILKLILLYCKVTASRFSTPSIIGLSSPNSVDMFILMQTTSTPHPFQISQQQSRWFPENYPSFPSCSRKCLNSTSNCAYELISLSLNELENRESNFSPILI